MATHGQRIKEMKVGQSIVVEKIPVGGSLEARRLSESTVMFYWRHTENKVTQREPVGPYDPSAPPKSFEPTTRGYSIEAGKESCRKLAKLNSETPGGLRAGRARVEAEKAAQDAALLEKARHTLKALCADYVAYLKREGKESWREAENLFAKNLPLSLLAMPASLVQELDVVTALRTVAEAGKATTARKVRAYLRAAYACAIRAKSDAAVPVAFTAYRVVTNPVDGMAPIKGRTDKNPLSLAELQRYWQELQHEEGVNGAALRLQVLSGGQRVLQLARLRESDAVGDVLLLRDGKGKRTEAREHLVPITKPIRQELSILQAQLDIGKHRRIDAGQDPGPGYLLSTDGGMTAMHGTSLSVWASGIGARAKITDFQLKRVRSGIETALAAAGISRDIRGQLQSHGLGGVQDRNYDAWEYLPQKREALDKLFGLLKRGSAKNVASDRRSSDA